MRGHREYDVLRQVQDLPGVPHQVELVIDGDRVFLLREAGEEPATWDDRHLAGLQETMAELVHRRITLGDRAQALVRADGSAFFCDFDHARSGLDCREAECWQDADSNYRCFLRLGLREADFTEALYRHLYLHCDFIAHYGRREFYAHFFKQPESTVTFLHQFDHDFGCRAVESGLTMWIDEHFYDAAYGDINRAMCQVFNRFKADLYARLHGEARDRDLAMARSLLAKHGLKMPAAPVNTAPSAPTKAVAIGLNLGA